MKKKSIATIGILLFIVAAGIIFYHLQATTQHLTETPPIEIALQPGNNDLTFPVVGGSYLLRVGISGMEPADFKFMIKGKIITPSGTQLIDETYEPTEDILNKRVNGGYVARYIQVREKKGNVLAHLSITCPDEEKLVCLFHGIK